MASQPVRVFISYSHDSPTHAQHILELANRLRADGVDAWIDQYEIAPPQGWPRWMREQIEQARFVLLVCTPTYRRRFEGKENPGEGKGVNWEGLLAEQVLYQAQTRNLKLIPVLFDGGDEAAVIPMALQPYKHHFIPKDYDALYRHITDQRAVVPPPLGQVRILPPDPVVMMQARSSGLPSEPPLPLSPEQHKRLFKLVDGSGAFYDREFRERIWTRLEELRRRVMPKAMLPDLYTLRLFLSELSRAAEQKYDITPLVSFATVIADLVPGTSAEPELRDWIQLACLTHGHDAPIPTRAAAKTKANHAYLVVSISNDGHGTHGASAQYDLKAWRMYNSPDDSAPLETDSPCTDEDLPDILNDLIFQALDDADVLTIELVLPIELLGKPVDAWASKAAPTRLFGHRYPVAVRSFERIYLPVCEPPGKISRRRPFSQWRESQGQWKWRWSRTKGMLNEPGIQAAIWEHGDGPPETPLYNKLRQDLERSCVIMSISPSPEHLKDLIEAGIPVAVWPRESFERHQIEKALDPVLAACLQHLPEKICSLRNGCDLTTLRRHLTLLWDDADRMPPDATDDVRYEAP